jgi:hypothetical protein
LKKRGETVRFDPIAKSDVPRLIFGDGGLELHFREVEGGYEYTGGLIEK